MNRMHCILYINFLYIDHCNHGKINCNLYLDIHKYFITFAKF